MQDKPRLTYVFPCFLRHEGLRHKYAGQKKALSKHYRVSAYALTVTGIHGLDYVVLTIRVIVATSISHVVYCRYNPKMLIIHAWLVVLSWFKCVYMEHNGNYEAELKRLGRWWECSLHLLTLWLFKYSKIRHVSYSQSMLKETWLYDQCHIIRNGYVPISGIAHSLETTSEKSALDQVKDYVSRYRKTGIFVGSNNPAHGLETVMEYVAQYPEIGFIFVGNFSCQTYRHGLKLPYLTYSTLADVYRLVHFGIGVMNMSIPRNSDASPLKTGEYLFHGLPVVIKGYFDWHQAHPQLAPFIFNVSEQPDGFAQIVKHGVLSEESRLHAQTALQWVLPYDHVVDGYAIDPAVYE